MAGGGEAVSAFWGWKVSGMRAMAFQRPPAVRSTALRKDAQELEFGGGQRNRVAVDRDAALLVGPNRAASQPSMMRLRLGPHS